MTQETGPGAWRDDPITKPEQDTLGRGHVVKRLKNLIDRNHSAESSIVYGLEGPWGSGKSSIIALLTKELSSSERPWQVATFTPWATTGTEALLTEFFNVLVSAAPSTRRRRKLYKALSTCLHIAAPLTESIPFFGGSVRRSLEHVGGTSQKTWSKAFNEAAGEISKIKSPVLIVVDDIDRLQRDELLDLLKVIRLIGRFPGVDFLLAYDEGSITEILASSGTTALSPRYARSFMEKIVQYPLRLPPLLFADVALLLEKELKQLFPRNHPTSTPEQEVEERWGHIISDLLAPQLGTTRSIKRFLTQVQEAREHHEPGEIDGPDLALSVLLRLNFPALFNELQHWRRKLTLPANTDLFEYTDQPTQDKEKEWEEIMKEVPENENTQDSLQLMKALFGNAYPGQRISPSSPRFSNPSYFDRYLIQGIPDGDIPISTITHALQQATDGNPSPLEALVLNTDERQSLTALKRLTQRYSLKKPDARNTDPSTPYSTELLRTSILLLDDPHFSKGSRSLLIELETWVTQLTLMSLAFKYNTNLSQILQDHAPAETRRRIISRALLHTKELNEHEYTKLKLVAEKEAAPLIEKLLSSLKEGENLRPETTLESIFTSIDSLHATPSAKARVRSAISVGDLEPIGTGVHFVSYINKSDDGQSLQGPYFDAEDFTEWTGVSARRHRGSSRDEKIPNTWQAKRKFVERFVTADTATVE